MLPGASVKEFKNKLRAPGLWIKTAAGWYSSPSWTRSSERLFEYSSLGIYDAGNNYDWISVSEISGAHFLELWCRFYQLRWRILGLYDDDGSLEAVENPRDLPFDAHRNADYQNRHRVRFPVTLDDPNIHVFIGHDDPHPKTFDRYQKIAAAIPNGRAYHPREYNGFRLSARVPLVRVTHLEEILKWTHGEQH